MWAWHDGPDGWGALWMFLVMGVFWIPALMIVVWSLRGFPASSDHGAPPPQPHRDGTPDAREIARRAYARGDTDRETFLRIIEDLDRTGQDDDTPVRGSRAPSP